MLPWPHRESHSDATTCAERRKRGPLCRRPYLVAWIICIRCSKPVPLHQQLSDRLRPAAARVPVVPEDIVVIPEHDAVACYRCSVVVADVGVIVAVANSDLIVGNQAMIEVSCR